MIEEGIVIDETVTEEQDSAYQGMTQNTYLFVQEKNVLTKDIENLSIYFEHQYVQPNQAIK